MKLKTFMGIILVIYVLLIIVVAVFPFGSISSGPTGSDKIYHFLEFLVFGMILFTFIHFYKPKKLYKYGLNIAGIVIVLSEVIQIFITTRSFSVWDLVADVLGVGVALLIVYFARK